jgi:hypothetical protein
MKDDGTQNDVAANDGIFGIILPPTFELGEIAYSIHAMDNNNQMSISPRCDQERITIEEAELKLAINEFMASNNTTIQDGLNEYDDWIELYNYGTNPIYLGDKYLSDNPENKNKWDMPHHTLQGGEYLLLWADDDRNQGTFHTNFQLSKSGEHLGIYDNDEQAIDQIDFGDQESDISYGRIPNGTGNFIPMTPTPNAPNVGASSVSEEDNFNLITIAPNPTAGEITINTKEDISDIRFLDAMGRSVSAHQVGKNTWQLPEAKGIYFLHIHTLVDRYFVKKVIKT